MSAPVIRVDRIGQEAQPVVVIDGFSSDPEALMAEAARLTYQAVGPHYPGVRALAPPSYFRDAGGLLADIAREVFGAEDRLSVDRAWFSLATTPPADLDLAQRIPHIDGVRPGILAIVHFLSRRDFGGTAFYRHRSTGFEFVDAARHRPYLDALRDDIAREGEPPSGYIGGDTALFERIAAYEPAFNRALVYRGGLLHCARLPNDTALPADPATGRLTIASFLSVR